MINNDRDTIIDSFVKLDPAHKKHLCKELSPELRKHLVGLINNNSHKITDHQAKTILSKIEQVKDKDLKITRKYDKVSPSALFMKEIKKGTDSFFSLGMTARDTNTIIKKIFIDRTSDNLPKISQEKLELLLTEAKDKDKPLSVILKENGFSTELKEISFKKIDADTHTGESLQGINFDNITFNGCEFYWPTFSGSKLVNVSFNNCTLENVSFMNSQLTNCRFENCDMREVMYTNANLVSVAFISCDLICNSFEDATLTHSYFNHSSMPGSHFLQSEINSSYIVNSNLKDAVLFESADKFEIDTTSKKTAQITRPVTTILVHPDARMISTPKAFMKLGQNAESIPLRITLQDQKVTKEDANKEVESLLHEASLLQGTEPIPQKLMSLFLENKSDYPNLKHIIEKSEKLSQVVDSLFLPGGEDIPPALYGAKEDAATQWGSDYRRSILEIGLIHHAKSKGIPLMGVCRGFQMTNVYYGAQLTQHVPGQLNKLQMFDVEPAMSSGLLNYVVKNSFIAEFFDTAPLIGGSAHHQAIMKGVSEAPTHLENILSREGIVKAVQPKESGSAPMVLLQFHPEFLDAPTADSMNRELIDFTMSIFLTSNNNDFWKVLKDSGQAYHDKKNLLNEMKSKLHPID